MLKIYVGNCSKSCVKSIRLELSFFRRFLNSHYLEEHQKAMERKGENHKQEEDIEADTRPTVICDTKELLLPAPAMI